MASLDITAADAALKIMYPPRAYRVITYKNHPLLAMLPKNKNFEGKQMEFPVRYGGNQGASRTFATAQAGKTPGKYTGFYLTRKKDYVLTDIDLEAILASSSDEGAFVRLAKSEVDGALQTAGNNWATSLYRNSGGARGQVGSISTTNLTLKNINDVVNFEVGMELVQSTADGTSGSLGSGDSVITGINRRTGVLVAANWTNFTANDFLFRKGDFGLSIQGLPGWIPAVAPTAGDNFFGVDRSVDTRLYGQYIDGSALTIQEALESADVITAREGGAISHTFMNPFDWNRLRVSLGSNVIFDKVKSPDEATISFSTIKMAGQKGDIQIVSDPDCTSGLCYSLTLDEWELATLGDAPRVLEGMGNKFIWSSNSDAIEVRVGGYGQLGCHTPSFNAQILLP
jgi:hypothetical protein